MPNKIFDWCDGWRREGFNYAITTAEKLIKYIADGNTPSGYGNSEYNRECFYQTARELEITRRDVLVPAINMLEKIRLTLESNLPDAIKVSTIETIMKSEK